MKQRIYIIGLVTTLMVITGAIFKVNHFPGAGIILSIGLIGLVMVFLPLALVNHFRSEESNKNILLYIVTWLTCFIVFVSMLFKVMHWPFAGLLLTIALPFPYIVFLPVFIGVTSKNKNFDIYNTVFVLLLLALNSVFSGLLAINVTRDRIEDSYNLSRDYNKLETVLIQLPDYYSKTPVNKKIDEIIKIINDYESSILNYDGITMAQWENNAGNLWRPDARGIAFKALNDNSGEPAGGKLFMGLKGLINAMEKTPGYEDIAKNAPVIFDLREPAEVEQDWVNRIFNDNNLAWTLIYLDGLKVNLIQINASVPTNLKVL